MSRYWISRLHKQKGCRVRRLSVLLCVAACSGALGARASEVTWNYAGNPFDTSPILDNPLLGDSLNASFTFKGPLAANLNGVDLSSDIVSWTIGDSFGVFSYGSGEPDVTLLGAVFSTDAKGNLIAFGSVAPEELVVISKAAMDPNKISCGKGTCMTFSQWTPLFVNPPAGNDSFQLWITSGFPELPGTDFITGPIGTDVDSSSVGVWTQAPEAGTVFIVAAGLLGLAVVAGKRRLFR